MPAIEVLFPTGSRPDIERLMGTVVSSAPYAGFTPALSSRYEGGCEWLCVYGVGREDIRHAVDAHKGKGGKVLLFDLGYWDRYTLQRKWRISIDSDHPSPEDVARTRPNPDRTTSLRLRFVRKRNARDRIERVLVVGLGPKSRAALSLTDAAWEREAVARVRAALPGAEVWYRPKSSLEDDVNLLPLVDKVVKEGPIDSTLSKVDLALCRHSNVSVDCAVTGTPCLIEGGIGRYLYGNTLPAESPSQEKRWDFLCRVAQWQWSRAEMYDCLRFVLQHARGAT